jgi:hypothetical protein
MRWRHWFRNELGQLRPHWVSRERPPGRGRLRPRLEQFEDRTLLASYTAATVSDLIKDINAANKAGGSNTITLVANTTFDLTEVNSNTDGPTGLPVITADDNLTIVGNDDTIDRSTAQNTPAFRLLDVASGGSLTLENLTLQNGLEDGSKGSSAEGGSVYNQGTAVLSGVTVQQNLAEGRAGKNGTKEHIDGFNGQDAAGGGIWSNGSLTLENSTVIENNRALGGTGGAGYAYALTIQGQGYISGIGGTGGNGSGGGLYVAGGTVDITNSTLSSNAAQGGTAGLTDEIPTWLQSTGGDGSGGGLTIAAGTVNLTGAFVTNNTAQGGGVHYGFDPNTVVEPGGGFGGGLCVAGGTANLSSDSVESNWAQDGLGFIPGIGLFTGGGAGGGIGIASGATVYIDGFTVNNTIDNGPDDIDGTYILQS